MIIFARQDLIESSADEPALLLEGDWPADEWRFRTRHSLDESIDARHAWIDAAAVELSERLAACEAFRFRLPGDEAGISLAWINGLSLRYYFVKLLRPIAYFEELATDESVVLHAALDGDEDYADVIGQLCLRRGVRFDVQWHSPQRPASAAAPGNGLLRRAASRLNAVLPLPLGGSEHERILLCGNPYILDPVCRELLTRDRSVAWLYDRFAFGAWGRWQPRGVRQLTCDSALGQSNGFCIAPKGPRQDSPGQRPGWKRPTNLGNAERVRPALWTTVVGAGRTLSGCLRFLRSGSQGVALDCPAKPLRGDFTHCHGIDLTDPVNRWLQRMGQQRGAGQTRLIEQVERHVGAWRPDAVVLDEDATPLARILVWAARRHGARSLVVQHGAPRVRFSFAPLAADRLLAWGESSAAQLAAWGVSREQIVIAGSPRANDREVRPHRACPMVKQFEQLASPPDLAAQTYSPSTKVDGVCARQILLFATTPPSDARPDAVEYHLTSRTHDDSLRMALAAVAGLPDARLTVKLHPRCRDGKPIERLIAEFPGLNYRIVRKGSLDRLIREAEVVLNCGSSAGIEAAHQGVPVIELLPAGARELTPADEWGLFGSASTFADLCELLDRALVWRLAPRGDSRRGATWHTVFAQVGKTAAGAIVDAIVGTHPVATNRHACVPQEVR